MKHLQVQILRHGAGIVDLPAYQSKGAAGLDLQAAISKQFTLLGGAREVIPTGIAIAIPDGYEGQVRPRSGLAAAHGITIVNAPGTIDCDYRGEIKVILLNTSGIPKVIKPGDRIAQLVIAPVVQLDVEQVERLDINTERGTSGFGSTGN